MTEGLAVRGLRVRHPHGPEVVRGIDIDAHPGEVLALMGPNGAGKSTVLKAMVGLLPHLGSIALDGRPLDGLTARERAHKVAYVPQRTALTARLSVRSVVELGRFAHVGPWAPLTRIDRAAVDRALEQTDTVQLSERPFPTLSGGEQQRVLLARALASEAPVLLLDEPTSALDVRQGLLLHRILRELAHAGRVLVVVLHDLAEVRTNADRVVLLTEGRVHTAGRVRDVVAPLPVHDVYGVQLVEGGGLSFRLPAQAES